ncbi:hypothetical protein KSP40_PGU000848 [Platanthera guangdongensis]|uniref:Uncharacterized protein n=1 Tax=Platanthera guangdongensis TaxID=2320717 RepID=A0ABR2N0G0_9ASPA
MSKDDDVEKILLRSMSDTEDDVLEMESPSLRMSRLSPQAFIESLWPKKPDQIVNLINSHGKLSTNSARFYNDGPIHDLEICVDNPWQRHVEVKVIIDSNMVYSMITEGRFGDVEKLYVDGRVVEFMWNLKHSQEIFSFKTRANDADNQNEHDFYWLVILGCQDQGWIQRCARELLTLPLFF